MKNIVSLFICFFFALQLNAQIPDGKTVISSLYIYTLETGKTTLVLREKRHFEAPNWSHDGQFLLINASGILEKVSTKGEKLGVLPTGDIVNANNDHGYSFDGKTLFISSSIPTIKEGSSFIFKVPSEGGSPLRLTANTPSYWHGVSPDGKTIVYCAERGGNYDVYALSTEGGAETRLTATEGLDDGPEYSPDGKYIYMNSFRTGKMQIWRMHPDGSNPEQVTFDNYSNWFAHVNPNNKVATIISYIEDQEQKHPFGKQVKLRLVNLKDKTIKDLTEPFFGGQGTINVPSWSPDGKKFAFVKYELEDKK
ncbi:MAG: transporter [Chitinophagia bacterium]|jgi:Tol biopolymer transport system component|nr:transporter [Chitinophagia bacterium]NCA29640.1 transporter [Chitinophagia bacterium]